MSSQHYGCSTIDEDLSLLLRMYTQQQSFAFQPCLPVKRFACLFRVTQ